MSESTLPLPSLSAPSVVKSRSALHWQILLTGIALALLWLVLFRHLSGEWSVNEQYSYGWFVPFFALFLLYLRWEDRPPLRGGSPTSQVPTPTLTDHQSPITDHGTPSPALLLSFLAAIPLLLLLPIRVFELGNPDWRPLGWAHALIVVGLTLALIWRIGGTPWLKHFAFPVCFILVAVPWVTPIEAPIVQGLMRLVARVATECLNMLGVPAALEGNLIRVRTGLVGVNEACSGVRSLQTSIMIGLLFGELKRLTAMRRIVLVFAALAVAIIANFGRAFTLVWISATDSPVEANQWHDVLGYAIVGVVFIVSIGISEWLGRGGRSAAKTRAERHGALPTVRWRPIPVPVLATGLIWLLAVEATAEFWYRAHEQGLIASTPWRVRMPQDAPGFRKVDIAEDVQRTLRYDEGWQVTWKMPEFAHAGTTTAPGSTAARPTMAMLFFFRWEAGSASILRARSHRPDICLPAAGWRQTADHGVREYAVGGGLSLPFRHFAFVRDLTGTPPTYAHSFFCMRENKVLTTRRSDGTTAFDLTSGAQPADWAVSDRVRIVKQGLRNPGQQAMQLVQLSPYPVTPAEAEARFMRQLPQLVQVAQP